MPVVGTAGHVDHGKSTLVKALTGRDPDRWEEEKRRGLTIDLGFAWTVLPNGIEISLVDVPGHERFMRNMLAGIESIDVALFVVAADEGWRAQSEEHLAVLDLLEVRHGVVALTKIDRVEEDLAKLAAVEITEKLAGTSLEGAPIIPVSATTGEGLNRLLDAISVAITNAQRPATGRSRMWVDRSFTITGAGTVVTGTLLDGELAVGDEVELWPRQALTRIRSIQSHEKPGQSVSPFRRAAINLVGVERRQIERGAMIGLPGQWRPSRRLLAAVRPTRYIEKLGSKGAYHIHVGSGGWPVEVRMLEPDLALLELPQPLCLQVGDRFILRETGRRAVVGGGRVIDPEPPSTARRARAGATRLRGALDRKPGEIADLLVEVRGSAPLPALAADTGGGVPRHAVVIDEIAYAPSLITSISSRLTSEASEFHRSNPLRPGFTAASIAPRWQLSPAVIDEIARHHPDLAVEHGLISSKAHRVSRDPSQEQAWEQARSLLNNGLAVPRVTELGLASELFHSLVREGRMVRIGQDLAYLPEQVDGLLQVIRSMPDPFTVGDFKDAAGISRKYAVPFLEWTDANNVTVRRGDLRTVK